jgi:hypothetical protein
MLERKRLAKRYHLVNGGEGVDVELGEGIGGQESGVVDRDTPQTLEEQVDNWDETAEDNWDDDDGAGADVVNGDGSKKPSGDKVGDDQ